MFQADPNLAATAERLIAELSRYAGAPPALPALPPGLDRTLPVGGPGLSDIRPVMIDDGGNRILASGRLDGPRGPPVAASIGPVEPLVPPAAGPLESGMAKGIPILTIAALAAVVYFTVLR